MNTLVGVRFGGQTGKHVLGVSFTEFDPVRTWLPSQFHRKYWPDASGEH